jgi:hypothetical protein
MLQFSKDTIQSQQFACCLFSVTFQEFFMRGNARQVTRGFRIGGRPQEIFREQACGWVDAD